MANGTKISYEDEEVAEFNAFRDWYNRLGSSGQSSIRARYGNLFGIGAGNPDDIGSYKSSVYYKAWQEAGGGVGVTETTEAKAAQFVANQAEYRTYQAQGGKLDYTTWVRSGKPPATPVAEPDGLAGIKEKGEFVGLEEHNGYLVPRYRRADGSTYLEWTEKTVSTKTEKEITEYQAGALDVERSRLEEEIRQFNEKTAQSGQMSDYEQSMMELQRQQLNEQIRQFNLQQQTAQQQMQQQMQMQEEMINWYREQQAAELEAQRQEKLAQLRANPASWLEYASLAGETPVVQPWMVPLSPKDYNMQAGQPLPGWTAQGESLKSLPELITPSTQYQARIAPSSRQQYYGYEQARTGATPEDVQWRLWSQAPPGAAGGSLSYVR